MIMRRVASTANVALEERLMIVRDVEQKKVK
jgi:hypothetical protein